MYGSMTQKKELFISTIASIITLTIAWFILLYVWGSMIEPVEKIIYTEEPLCFFDDNTWYWRTNVPCPKDLFNNIADD